jgi:hypothetical protein
MRRLLLSLRAHGAVFEASLRIAWWERRLPLDELVARLRMGPVFAGPFNDPDLLAETAESALRWLSHLRMGTCLKRSLLLVHLWSRCGLEPVFHLGTERAGAGELRGHAWVTVPGREQGPPGTRFAEILSL